MDAELRLPFLVNQDKSVMYSDKSKHKLPSVLSLCPLWLNIRDEKM